MKSQSRIAVEIALLVVFCSVSAFSLLVLSGRLANDCNSLERDIEHAKKEIQKAKGIEKHYVDFDKKCRELANAVKDLDALFFTPKDISGTNAKVEHLAHQNGLQVIAVTHGEISHREFYDFVTLRLKVAASDDQLISFIEDVDEWRMCARITEVACDPSRGEGGSPDARALSFEVAMAIHFQKWFDPSDLSF